MAHTSEYEIEDIFIDRLEGIGYKFIKLNNELPDKWATNSTLKT